ncbi:heat shock transcription factor [Purpureocillium lilacinum]|uniref:Heat shock transcription factor n=1 Tax=Purpureocillium lilacinum TaxID=33203 RepID=A0A179GQX5_PURLI|nr:heat shock transcription factor [Purpureocillium lilacinum]
MGARVVPVSAPAANMSSSGHGGDAMDITSPSSKTSPTNNETNGKPPAQAQASNSSPPEQAPSSSSSMPAPPPAAAAVHQPKIVQTAFIHKLYNMLEDNSIQHLISWSANAESFVMSPSADFSKVLSQYFKHTNISSFVRQLNMYGFHKERDVFHTGNPDTTLWEFKHGNGNFKRGDLMGLREIKRRASRHALVHRESNYPKQSSSQPGTPAEPAPPPAEGSEARLAHLEHSLYDLSNRLQRSEENAHYMHVKNQAAMDTITRLLHFNQELSRAVLSLVPAESSAHRDVVALQGEMQRQSDVMRTFDESHETPYPSRQQYFGTVENAPVSPRQLPQDDARRQGGLTVPQPRGQPMYRPTVPSNLSIGARRYGSIGGGSTTQSSPLRNAAPPPPPAPHPLSNVEPHPASLGRRHTAADIRAHGWQPGPSPFSASNPPSAPWPSSPSRVPQEDQRLRESLSTYSLQAASHSHSQSRPTTPPPAPHVTNGGGNNGADTFGTWSWGAAVNRDGKGLGLKDSSAPPTRRGSMAHILNPSDTAERSDEDEDPRGDDDRKRKRMQ